MGDMADFALDGAMDDLDIAFNLRHASPAERYEAGLIDEQGYVIGNPSSLPTAGNLRVKAKQQAYAKAHNPTGEGPCPKCGGETVKRKGKFGKFWGCSAWPDCNGSRNA